MRRLVVVAGLVGMLGLAACGTSGSGTDSTNSTPASTPATTPAVPMGNGNPITGPIDRARSVVGQQNSQLSQEEQRAGSADPTQP
jgi:hypothetical protein